MKKLMIYKGLAKYYDLIYDWKNYKKETNKIKKLISKYKKSKGNRLLDVACGTGKHLKYLKNNFSCMGVDVNNEMLDIAKKNVKNVTFKKANMLTLNLNKKFDVITCLFSAIGHLKTYQTLRKTIWNFAKHMKSGGILIVEGWITKNSYNVGTPGMTLYDGKNIKIARLNDSKIKGNMSMMNFHYLIAEKNKNVKYFVDRAEMGLFEMNEFLKIMRDAGFKAKFFKNGLMKDRGLYIGVKV